MLTAVHTEPMLGALKCLKCKNVQNVGGNSYSFCPFCFAMARAFSRNSRTFSKGRVRVPGWTLPRKVDSQEAHLRDSPQGKPMEQEPDPEKLHFLSNLLLGAPGRMTLGVKCPPGQSGITQRIEGYAHTYPPTHWSSFSVKRHTDIGSQLKLVVQCYIHRSKC